MKKRIFTAAVAVFFGIVTFSLVVKADYTLWNDVLTSTPTYNNWPTTLAVILVEFPDVTHERYQDSGMTWHNFQAVYTWQNFYDMLASDNVYYSPTRFSPDGEEVFGSLRDWCGSMSNGAYRPTIEILNDQTSGNPNLPPQWFMMPNTKAYYDALTPYSTLFATITNDAIAAAQNAGKNVTIDANRRLCIIHAGNRRTNINGAAYLGGSRYLSFERWKWTQQDAYNIEYQDAPFTHMGAHTHEFAHVRGSHHDSANRWSVLGDGQKNGAGPSFAACPAPLNPWHRSLDGWVTLTSVTSDINNANLVYNGTPNNYKINLTRPSDGQAESFLVENRQFTSGYDIWLPGANGGTGGPGGLLVWDILGNNAAVENAVDLIEADNTPINDATSLLTDIFRPDGTYPYQKIFDYSSPATLKFRDGSVSHFAVENYTANGNTITVNFKTSSLTSNSSDVIASNSSRKLIRDSGGAYHLVYETQGEIYYQKSTDGGGTWASYKRLSAGNGSNKFPCIAERSGKLYVFWQRKTGTNTYATHFRHHNGASWENLRTVNGTITSSNDLTPVLAVSTPAASFEMMVVYRTNSGVRFRRSTSSNGASWEAAATVTSNTSARNPSLVYWQDPDVPNLKFHVTWDDGSNISHQTFNGTSWGSPLTLSSIPMTSGHQYSSYAITGSADRHIVWQALESETFLRQVIYHNKNLTNIYTALGSMSYDHLRPNVTGNAGAVATVVCHETSSNKNVRKRRYNGTSWESTSSGTIIASNSADASASIANPPGATALAVWRSAGNAPYTLAAGPSGGLSKENANETLAYHRRIVFSLSNSSTLALQMGTVQLHSASGKNEQSFPFVSDQDSIEINDLAAALKLSNVLLPADADSLAFEVKVYGHDAGNLRSDPSKSLELIFDLLSAGTGYPLANIKLAPLNNTGTARQFARLVFPVQALRGRQVHLAPAVSNLNLAKANGALVHVYEVVEDGAQKTSAETPSLVAASQPTSFSVRVYPNPFNPSTQIHFCLPSVGVVSVRVYDVNGRMVKELSHGFRAAGEHVVT